MSACDFDISRIMTLLPHRYPFLLIDKVLNTDRSQYLMALKNVSINEPFFQGHFPGRPVMPGVLVLEAMAQASGLLASFVATEDCQTHLHMLVGIDKARFRSQVLPGDQLKLEVCLTRSMRGIGVYQCHACVNGNRVAEAVIMCSVQNRDV